MATNPIGFDKLFNFNDDTEVQKAIKLIEQLGAGYEKLVSSATKSSQEYAQAISAIVDSAKKLEGQMSNLNAADKTHQDTIVKSASEADKLLKKHEQTSKALKAEEQQIQLLIDQQKKLISAKEKLKKVADAESGSIDDLKKKLSDAIKAYTAMGDATDKAVKEEALQKIRTLAKNVELADQAMKAAKKATDFAAGSYNELAHKVNDANKRLREMKGGIGSNTKEFKELQKFSAEGTKKLKEFDEAVGIHNRHVGDYANQIGKLHPRLGALAGGFMQVTEAAMAFVSNPVVATIALIAGAIIGLTKAAKFYFESSIEGQDKLTDLMVGFNASTAIAKNLFRDLGKSVVDFFTGAHEQNKEFWKDFISIGVSAMAIVASGFSPVLIKQFYDLLKARHKQQFEAAQNLGNLEKTLAKERIRDIIGDANSELQIREKLEKSGDKLRQTDEQRYKALREANRISRESTQGDLALSELEIAAQREQIALQGYRMKQDEGALDLLTNEEAMRKVNYEDVQKLAELEAAHIKLQSDAAIKRRQFLKAEIQLIREIESERRAIQKQEEAASKALSDIISKGRIDANKEVLADERSTLEDRLYALDSIAKEQTKIAEDTRSRELADAKDAALDRILLDEETLDKIYSNEQYSVAQRIELVRKFKEQYLTEHADQDKTYLDQVDKTNTEYAQKITEITQTTVQAGKDNVFAQWKRDYEDFIAETATGSATALLGLNEAFENGEISLEAYERRRKEIQEKAQVESVNSQIKYLEKMRDNLKANGYDVSKIDQQIAELRLKTSQMTTDQLIAYEKRLRAEVEAIGWEAFETVRSIADARFEKNISVLEGQLEAEQQSKEASLRIVADDDQAKAFIEEQSAIRQREIQKQIASEKRKAAIFQKAADATGVGIDTAKGISRAVAESPLTFGLPWSAFVAVNGALQLAKILASPIPQFWRGTDYSPEGFAELAERGREIVIDPQGKIDIADKRQYRYLQEGSIVIPNSPSEQLLRDARLYGDSYIGDKVSTQGDLLRGVLPTPADFNKVTNAINDGNRQIVKAIKTQPRDVWDDKGHRHFEGDLNHRVEILNQRYRFK